MKNLLESPFRGPVYAVNPKETEVQGVKCYANVSDLPQVDCAILCIAAKFCAQTVDVLAKEKGCKGFIIISAGFSEESHEGAEIENDQGPATVPSAQVSAVLHVELVCSLYWMVWVCIEFLLLTELML